MVPRTKVFTLLLLAAMSALAAGCGKGGADSGAKLERDALQDIYDCYTEYVKNNQRPPKQLADLKKSEVMHPLGVRVLTEGTYVAVWGVTGKDAGTVLAYAKEAPAQGGAVLMADGSIKVMSAAEFQAATKGKS